MWATCWRPRLETKHASASTFRSPVVHVGHFFTSGLEDGGESRACEVMSGSDRLQLYCNCAHVLKLK